MAKGLGEMIAYLLIGMIVVLLCIGFVKLCRWLLGY